MRRTSHLAMLLSGLALWMGAFGQTARAQGHDGAAEGSTERAEDPGGKPIRTLKEIRGEGVVRQRWDMSCGAAL